MSTTDVMQNQKHENQTVGSRSIRFRAWYQETKWPTPFDEMYYSDRDYETLANFFKDYQIASSPTETLKAVLMQYTGLKDKNGKEVFELMEIDGKYRVLYDAPSYVLQDISTGDIIPIYDQFEITGDYSPLS